MGKFRNRPQPMPDPNADPSDFQVSDPVTRQRLGLPPLVNPVQPLGGLPVASPLGGGVAVQPLPTSIPSPAPSQGPLATPQVSSLGNAPAPPVAPDTSVERAARGQLLHSQATTAVNPYELQDAQNASHLQALQAQQSAMPQYDPNSAAYHWTPLTPQSLGAPQQAPLPTRSAPGHDPAAQGLAALASIFDTKGAGAFSAQPIMAGVQVANQQYEDRQRQFAQAQAQMNAEYEANRANAEQANRFGIINQQEQHGADVASLTDQQRLQQLHAGLVGGVAGAQSLADTLPGFVSRTTHSAELGSSADTLEADIQAKMQGYKNAADMYEKTYGPYAKYLQNLNTNSTRQGVAETNAGAKTEAATITTEGRVKVGEGHDTAHLGGIDKQQAGANSRNAATNAQSDKNNQRSNAPDPDAPTGKAAKNPDVQNAYTLYRDFKSDLAKTERILEMGWKSAGGANIEDNAAKARWMHGDSTWQRQAKAANDAYEDYSKKMTNANTETPKGAGDTTPPPRVPPPTSRYGAPPPGTPRVIIR